MCEFTVYLDGHDDENVVGNNVIKATVKQDCIVLVDTSGKITKIPDSRIVKVDTIMTELLLETNGTVNR